MLLLVLLLLLHTVWPTVCCPSPLRLVPHGRHHEASISRHHARWVGISRRQHMGRVHSRKHPGLHHARCLAVSGPHHGHEGRSRVRVRRRVRGEGQRMRGDGVRVGVQGLGSCTACSAQACSGSRHCRRVRCHLGSLPALLLFTSCSFCKPSFPLPLAATTAAASAALGWH